MYNTAKSLVFNLCTTFSNLYQTDKSNSFLMMHFLPCLLQAFLVFLIFIFKSTFYFIQYLQTNLDMKLPDISKTFPTVTHSRICHHSTITVHQAGVKLLFSNFVTYTLSCVSSLTSQTPAFQKILGFKVGITQANGYHP